MALDVYKRKTPVGYGSPQIGVTRYPSTGGEIVNPFLRTLERERRTKEIEDDRRERVRLKTRIGNLQKPLPSVKTVNVGGVKATYQKVIPSLKPEDKNLSLEELEIRRQQNENIIQSNKDNADTNLNSVLQASRFNREAYNVNFGRMLGVVYGDKDVGKISFREEKDVLTYLTKLEEAGHKHTALYLSKYIIGNDNITAHNNRQQRNAERKTLDEKIFDTFMEGKTPSKEMEKSAKNLGISVPVIKERANDELENMSFMNAFWGAVDRNKNFFSPDKNKKRGPWEMMKNMGIIWIDESGNKFIANPEEGKLGRPISADDEKRLGILFGSLVGQAKAVLGKEATEESNRLTMELVTISSGLNSKFQKAIEDGRLDPEEIKYMNGLIKPLQDKLKKYFEEGYSTNPHLAKAHFKALTDVKKLTSELGKLTGDFFEKNFNELYGKLNITLIKLKALKKTGENPQQLANEVGKNVRLILDMATEKKFFTKVGDLKNNPETMSKLRTLASSFIELVDKNNGRTNQLIDALTNNRNPFLPTSKKPADQNAAEIVVKTLDEMETDDPSVAEVPVDIEDTLQWTSQNPDKMADYVLKMNVLPARLFQALKRITEINSGEINPLEFYRLFQFYNNISSKRRESWLENIGIDKNMRERFNDFEYGLNNVDIDPKSENRQFDRVIQALNYMYKSDVLVPPKQKKPRGELLDDAKKIAGDLTEIVNHSGLSRGQYDSEAEQQTDVVSTAAGFKPSYKPDAISGKFDNINEIPGHLRGMIINQLAKLLEQGVSRDQVKGALQQWVNGRFAISNLGRAFGNINKLSIAYYAPEIVFDSKGTGPKDYHVWDSYLKEKYIPDILKANNVPEEKIKEIRDGLGKQYWISYHPTKKKWFLFKNDLENLEKGDAVQTNISESLVRRPDLNREVIHFDLDNAVASSDFKDFRNDTGVDTDKRKMLLKNIEKERKKSGKERAEETDSTLKVAQRGLINLIEHSGGESTKGIRRHEEYINLRRRKLGLPPRDFVGEFWDAQIEPDL